jgi:hypothetical protein
MMTSAERGRRFRARQRGEDVPKLPPGRKTDHLYKAIEAVLAAVEHVNQVPVDDLESLEKK